MRAAAAARGFFMRSVYEMYKRLMEISENGCTIKEADKFFSETAACLKSYVCDNIDSFFKSASEDYEDALIKGDFEEADEQLDLIGDVLDDFIRNEEEENFRGVPQVIYHFPKKPEDVFAVGDAINNLLTVVVNVSHLDTTAVMGVLDFLAGAAYCNGARMIQTSDSTFIIVPYHIEVPENEIIDYIEKNGIAVKL
jgi:FtsZ-interacting cell division protein YlmF